MTTLTDEQKTEVEKKPEYIELKAELLKEYKSYERNLEYADDEFEEDLIMQEREKLATRIKGLGAKIRDIESLEGKA
ncbi:hypothetical protein ACLHDG_08345 [Sulfurovum sp. CS9]|uniref:hypothetical protein n=1 Tax=Sulfurovum sp. CS9 TaxID=3391146 RepID=UPI0039E8BFE6